MERNTAPSAAYASNGNGSSPHIKQESFDTAFLALPPRAPTQNIGSDYASQRAAQLMQQQFGSQANSSITALQTAQMAQRQQQQQSHHQSQQQLQNQKPSTFHPSYPQQSPYGNMQGAPISQAHASQRAKQDAIPHLKQEPTDAKPSGLGDAQTDGAGDDTDLVGAFVARRNLQGIEEPMGRLALTSGTLREMVERNAQRLEAGGLMVPLEDRLPSQRRARKPKSSITHRADSGLSSSAPRYPDETADTTQEGVYEGDVILCLYDKVQRVKNKWKCVLRDGILTIDGKE